MADKDYPYTSLCVVTEIKDNGVFVLKRLADIENHKIQMQFSSFIPTYKILYNKGCKLSVNSIGVFHWQAKRDLTRYGSIYITSEYSFDEVPIEIFILESCVGINDLRNKLLNGLRINFSTERFLIVYHSSDDIYCGVLCTKNDCERLYDREIIIAKHLPFFEVDKKDFIQIEKKIFYSKLNLENPTRIFHKKPFSEFIKAKLISRANWTTFKNRVSERDLQIFCEYLKNFSTEDFYSEIAKEYSMSEEETVKQVNDFVSANEEYLRAEIFNDEVFSNILVNCPRLLEVLQEMSYEQWQANNQENISEANLQLDKLHQEIDSELKNCLDLENEIESKKAELAEISSRIKQREELATEVEKKIAQRIDLARKNVADFICEMAFVNPNFGELATSKNNFYRAGKTVEGDEIEIEDLQDFIYTLETELGVEGTQNENILPFAAYLTAAYMNKILLLLAGPSARDIADAFSVTLTGKTSAIFDCANVNSFADLEIISDSDDEIIAVLNPFAPNFIAYLPELVNIKEKFIFAIYPFAEDLKIEPRSFYNYFLPIFTELLIDRPPARNFSTKWSLPDKLRQELKQGYNPDKISISAEKRMQKLKKDMREFLQEKKSAELFADFPLAYVKGQEEKFMANFKDGEKILEKIREFLGESS